jgi:uncharacterized protein with HEPN domain
VRLIEIGEAVKGITSQLLDHEPDIPWSAIARMRDHLTHRYFEPTMPSCRTSSTTNSSRS